jgi:putative two-component system response regulator
MDSMEKKVILTVDDTAVNLAILRSMLRNNYNVRVCKDAYLAKYIVDHVPIDMALLDVNISGFELLEYIQSKPERIPVILVTTFVNQEFTNKAIDAGALDYIIKPIQPDVLYRKVSSILHSTKKNWRQRSPEDDEKEAEKKPVLNKNASRIEIVDYLSYMLTVLNDACLSGYCDKVEQLVNELSRYNFGEIINRKIDELSALIIKFDYQAMIKNISAIFIALDEVDIHLLS